MPHCRGRRIGPGLVSCMGHPIWALEGFSSPACAGDPGRAGPPELYTRAGEAAQVPNPPGLSAGLRPVALRRQVLRLAPSQAFPHLGADTQDDLADVLADDRVV